jgi:hypothetical protein
MTFGVAAAQGRVAQRGFLYRSAAFPGRSSLKKTGVPVFSRATVICSLLRPGKAALRHFGNRPVRRLEGINNQYLVISIAAQEL